MLLTSDRGLRQPDCIVRPANVELKPHNAATKITDEVGIKEITCPSKTDEPKLSAAGEGRSTTDDSQLEDLSQELKTKLLQMARAKLEQTFSQCPGQYVAAPVSGAHDHSQRLKTLGCSNCAPSKQHEQGSSEEATCCLASSMDEQGSLVVAQTETPLTEGFDEMFESEGELANEEGDDERDNEVDEGLWGWPHPSAVECIRDDVCRLCLTDPDLERVIATCVDEHLRSTVRSVPDYYPWS